MAVTSEDINDQLRRLNISESNVEFLRDQDLGRGAYGRVFKARYHGFLCAAKEIHSILIDAAYTPAERRKLRENFIRECYHCSKLTHPKIVHFIGIYHPPQQLFPVMVMELMDESLTTYAEKPNISFERRMSILHDVAEGLSYLHSRNPPVIHRDLSPNNILLKHLSLLPVAKIADLGVAKIINVDDKSSKSYQTKVPGTVDFMPLEAFGDKPKYGTPLDVFSYGGIMLYTVNGKWPSPTALANFDPVTRQAKAYTEVERRQEYLDKMTGEAEVLKPLVEACLDNDPVKRPSIVELSEKMRSLKVRGFNEVEFCQESLDKMIGEAEVLRSLVEACSDNDPVKRPSIAELSQNIKPLKESPPLVPTLLSGCYDITWEKCAELPAPLYHASVALHDNKVYTMAGGAPDDNTLDYVYVYDVLGNHWDRLPSPEQNKGTLQIINSKLTVIGGWDNTRKRTNKVTTYNNNSWKTYYPNMIKARVRPGAVTHLDYVIVVGGGLDDNTVSNEIEMLNYNQSSHWVIARMKLPEPMRAPSLTISDDLLYIVGYNRATDRTNRAYQAPVDIITSSADQLTSNHWTKLPSAPHLHTAIIPNMSPPTIIGGDDIKGVPTVDIRVLDVPKDSWKKMASLATARVSTAVVSLNHHSILVIGGYTDGRGHKEAKANSITTVEKGTVRLCHTQ